MYYYLFDSQLSEPKYGPLVNRIEFRIVELGINGRVDRLSILKNMRELIEGAIKRGAETVVIIGDDAAIARAVSIVAPHNITLGIIPAGPQQRIARALGIPEGEQACDVLSKRVIRTIDLGKVNDQYFLFSLDVPSKGVTLECDGRYRVTLMGVPKPFSIFNFRPDHAATAFGGPEDGLLEAVIEEPPRGFFLFRRRDHRPTVLPLRKARIQSADSSIALLLDGSTVVKTPATVEVAPRKLRVIVGKERQF